MAGTRASGVIDPSHTAAPMANSRASASACVGASISIEKREVPTVYGNDQILDVGDFMAERPFPSFLIYKDAKGEYRWRLQASNALVIADSGEGYTTKANCLHGISLVAATNSSTPVWKTNDVE